MSKNPSGTRRASLKKDGVSKASKQNVDTIYLVQNQNQVLKLKNAELQEKISIMKSDLINFTSNLTKDQQQCQALRIQIRRTELTDDMRLQAEKRSIEDKIQLIKGNCQIVARKIGQAREAAIFQQQKIPSIKQEKKVLDRALWESKTQNQGTKIVLENLEKQLEKYRSENSQLVSKRKQYGPKQSQISKLIQQRLRIIKNRQKSNAIISKKQAGELIYMLLDRLTISKNKQNFMTLQNFSLTNKKIKKQIFLLSLIRRKYLLYIKNQAMQKFRTSFRPLQQLSSFQRIVANTKKRRLKNQMFRIWRSQANKREYIKIRYFQAQTSIQKFSQSYMNTLVFSAFNKIKYFRFNPIHRRAAAVIFSISKSAVKRSQNLFFSALMSAQNNYLKDLQIEQSAKQQSILLVMSIYFSNWAKLTKDNKVSNRYIKFKYFRQLKKLLALNKKRDLSEMLTIANQKIKQIDNMSFSFCHMKKQTINGLIQSLHQQKTTVENKNESLSNTIKQYQQNNKETANTFGVLKISKYLKKVTQKAFNVWRSHNSKIHKLNVVMNMLHGKLENDLNLGFAKIQKRRFQKLKLSIADKIQSCEFSYNYLVKENTHIKEVLDQKLLELQKSKFSNILRRLIRNQKQIKHKYFYKFLKNGFKFWKFRKIAQRIDKLIQQKTKMVFMFLLKQINKQKIRQNKIENKVNIKANGKQRQLLSLVFGVFQNVKTKNKKCKRILQNIFNRNLQLNVYNGYNMIKRIYTKAKQDTVEAINTAVETKIKEANKHTENTQQTIQMLRQRLSKKQTSLKDRITLACRKIYVRNSSNKYMHYFNKWRNKLKQEKKVKQFVSLLERKTRILLKNRLVTNLIKKNGQQQVNQLKTRLYNFNKDLNDQITNFEGFAEKSENQMKNMEKQNENHISEGKILEKKTDRMDDVKIASFRNYWGKVICKWALNQWRVQKNQFIDQWKRVFSLLQAHSRKETFLILSQQMKNQITKNKIRTNLSYIYAKKFRHNAGLAFKIWRIVNLNARMKHSKESYDLEVSNHKLVSGKFQNIVLAYETSVQSRANDRKLRKIFDFLKKYTRLKIDNNKNKLRLEKWLKHGYQIQFYRLFYNKCKLEVDKNKKADKFLASKPENIVKSLFYKLWQIVYKKKMIKKLFLGKFIYYSMNKLYEQFFAKTKNYYRYVEVSKKNHQTFCIQKMIQTFDKKRKDILCKNLRKWRKNQYEINIGKKLFKRLTRKAIYHRYQGMFYAWKLQSQAKKVVKYHNEEGEVKKRKVEIQRIEKFLHEFKKDKGLLLQNQEGNFVMSPRFQKKKQEEQKKDKNLRYKFISRLIMTINGYGSPIKAYNNLQIYMKLREKYRKSALFVVNHMRRPDTFLAFRTWRKIATHFREDFQNMQRKQLIKILNRQKDKMEMEYSNKLSVDEKIETELQRYKIYSHQRDKKQKLCAHVLMRNAKRVKDFAFGTWKKRVIQMRNKQNRQLAQRGESRLQDIQEQIREMKQIQQQLMFSNQTLRQAVSEAVQIAEMVKRITEQRDKLSHLILEKNLTCESLIQQNQILNSKLHLAQKEAIRLLVISGEQP